MSEHWEAFIYFKKHTRLVLPDYIEAIFLLLLIILMHSTIVFQHPCGVREREKNAPVDVIAVAEIIEIQ